MFSGFGAEGEKTVKWLMTLSFCISQGLFMQDWIEMYSFGFLQTGKEYSAFIKKLLFYMYEMHIYVYLHVHSTSVLLVWKGVWKDINAAIYYHEII